MLMVAAGADPGVLAGAGRRCAQPDAAPAAGGAGAVSNPADR